MSVTASSSLDPTAGPVRLATFPATKFAPPRIEPELWRRPAVRRLFGDAANRPVVIVHGLPGSGKRDFITQWLKDQGHADPNQQHPIAWISCDEADADPSTLWTAFEVAVSRAVGGDVPEASPFARMSPTDAASVLVDKIDQSHVPLTIVVDQAHRAGHAVATLQPLLEWLPSGTRMVFSTSRTLPLSLDWLRLRRAVYEITPVDLALRLDELIGLMSARDVNVDPAAATEILRLSGGWQVAARKLMVTNASGAGSQQATVGDTGSVPTEIKNLIRDEVLVDLEDGIVRLLADLSELDMFSTADVRSVLAHRRADYVLEAAEERCCISADSRGMFRFQPVISRYLRAERDGLDALRRAEVHQRAAARFSEAGRIREAVRHRLAAHDIDGALDELTSSRIMWCGGRQNEDPSANTWQSSAISWLSEIDPLLLRSGGSPTSMAKYALALALVGEHGDAAHWLQTFDETARSSKDAQGYVASTELLIAISTGSLTAARKTRDTLVELAGSWSIPSPVLVAMIDVSTWIDDNATARALCALVDAQMDFTWGDDLCVAAAYSYNAAVAGHLRAAQRLAEATLASADRHRLGDHLAILNAHRALALVDYERGRFVAAQTRLSAVVDRVGDDDPTIAILSRAALADTYIAAGRLDQAERELSGAQDLLVDHIPSPLTDHLQTAAVQLAIARGDLRGARDLAAQMATPWRRELWRRRIAVRGLVDDNRVSGVGDDYPTTPRVRIDHAVLDAAIAMRDRDQPTAERHLRVAVELAIDEDWLRPFFEFGLLIWPALRRVLLEWPHRSFHDDAEQLAESIRSDAATEARRHVGDRIDQLLPRERDVLRLLIEEQSTRAIASALFVSVNTVKTHVRAVYRKLGVHSRAELLASLGGLDAGSERPSPDLD